MKLLKFYDKPHILVHDSYHRFVLDICGRCQKFFLRLVVYRKIQELTAEKSHLMAPCVVINIFLI